MFKIDKQSKYMIAQKWEIITNNYKNKNPLHILSCGVGK